MIFFQFFDKNREEWSFVERTEPAFNENGEVFSQFVLSLKQFDQTFNLNRSFIPDKLFLLL